MHKEFARGGTFLEFKIGLCPLRLNKYDVVI